MAAQQSQHSSDIKLIMITFVLVILLLVAAVTLFLPALNSVTTEFNNGLTLKEAVPWGFGVTVTLLVLFAIVAGDGLIGELQFMLGSFFIFFFILTLLIAWVF